MGFKVGDRVRLTGEQWKNEFAGGAGHSMWGTEHVITHFWEDDPVFIYDGQDWFIEPDGYEAELVHRPTIKDLSGSNPTDPDTPAPWFPLDLDPDTPVTAEEIKAIGKIAKELGVRVPDPYEDKVNPSHYSQYGIEVIDLVRHMPYLEGNCIKYLTRAPFKGQEVEDLLKARRYLDWAIEDAKAKEAGNE